MSIVSNNVLGISMLTLVGTALMSNHACARCDDGYSELIEKTKTRIIESSRVSFSSDYFGKIEHGCAVLTFQIDADGRAREIKIVRIDPQIWAFEQYARKFTNGLKFTRQSGTVPGAVMVEFDSHHGSGAGNVRPNADR
jgi:hypothetical protein